MPTRRLDVHCVFPGEKQGDIAQSPHQQKSGEPVTGTVGRNGFQEGNGSPPPRHPRPQGGTEISPESGQLPRVPEEAHSPLDIKVMW